MSRRWVLFALAVAILAYGAWWLGEWQFHRLADREHRNAITRHNLAAPPVPVDELLEPGRPVDQAHEWRRVTATGRYVDSETVIIRYQTRNGASGVDVVTPLRTTAGPALLVDRGWMQTKNVGAATQQAPPPPPGTVTVTGWLRADATGDSAVVSDRSARSVSSVEIGRHLPFPVYSGFVDALSESPKPAQPLVPAEPPDLGNGPHFFYGLQWWFFGVLAVFGFFYLAWDEHRKRRRASAADGEASEATGPASDRRPPAA